MIVFLGVPSIVQIRQPNFQAVRAGQPADVDPLWAFAPAPSPWWAATAPPCLWPGALRTLAIRVATEDPVHRRPPPTRPDRRPSIDGRPARQISLSATTPSGHHRAQRRPACWGKKRSKHERPQQHVPPPPPCFQLTSPWVSARAEQAAQPDRMTFPIYTVPMIAAACNPQSGRIRRQDHGIYGRDQRHRRNLPVARPGMAMITLKNLAAAELLCRWWS